MPSKYSQSGPYKSDVGRVKSIKTTATVVAALATIHTNF